ncbi:lipocalin-like isoform 2-T2 [Lycodopsis pacificus]
MRNTLLRMLGALMCVLAACAAVTPVQDFDLQKMAGKWYVVGLATNAQWFVSIKAGMKTGTAMLVPTGEDLGISYSNLNADGTCWRMTHLAKKTEILGRFTFHSQSRTPVASAVLQQKFTQLSLETGILADNIAILPQNAECAEV